MIYHNYLLRISLPLFSTFIILITTYVKNLFIIVIFYSCCFTTDGYSILLINAALLPVLVLVLNA